MMMMILIIKCRYVWFFSREIWSWFWAALKADRAILPYLVSCAQLPWNTQIYNTSQSVEQYKHIKQNETLATEPPITQSPLSSYKIVKIGLLTLSAATIGFKHNIKGGCQEYSGSYLFLFLNINTSVNNANNLFLYTTNKNNSSSIPAPVFWWLLFGEQRYSWQFLSILILLRSDIILFCYLSRNARQLNG